MDSGEREAVLSLVPYFSKERIVFDVGSNKGEWADLLVHNVNKMHLFEPNIKLLHYTEIKYAELGNVTYYQEAVSSGKGSRPFYLYYGKYNGLSSLEVDSRWSGLPSGTVHVNIITLDKQSKYLGNNFNHIDFLKIDVEGHEFEVLKGAKNLLSDKKIKFIQFEYDPFYAYELQDVALFIEPFGYKIRAYNPSSGFDYYTDIVKKERQNLYIMDQNFTEDWNQEFRNNTKGMKFDLALEVGCFEGLTTCHICDFLLNEGGRIIAIDPLENEYLPEDSDEAKEINAPLKQFKGQYERFIRNTRNKPVELIRKKSQDVWNDEDFQHYKFDFIYIDGDHRKQAVYNDAKGAWRVLFDQGGIMLFDDYEWSQGTKKGIDRFLKEHQAEIEILHQGYQVMIRKNVE